MEKIPFKIRVIIPFIFYLLIVPFIFLLTEIFHIFNIYIKMENEKWASIKNNTVLGNQVVIPNWLICIIGCYLWFVLFIIIL